MDNARTTTERSGRAKYASECSREAARRRGDLRIPSRRSLTAAFGTSLRAVNMEGTRFSFYTSEWNSMAAICNPDRTSIPFKYQPGNSERLVDRSTDTSEGSGPRLPARALERSDETAR